MLAVMYSISKMAVILVYTTVILYEFNLIIKIFGWGGGG